MRQNINIYHLREFARQGEVSQAPFQESHVFVPSRAHCLKASHLNSFLQSKESSLSLVYLDLMFQLLHQPGLWVSQRTWEAIVESGTWPRPALEPSFSLWNPESHGLPCTGHVSLQGLATALKMWIVDNVQGDRMWQIKKYPVWGSLRITLTVGRRERK